MCTVHFTLQTVLHGPYTVKFVQFVQFVQCIQSDNEERKRKSIKENL